MLNVNFTGNVTGDPELRFLNDGTAVASFSVAVNDRVYDRATGAYKDGETMYIRCTAWRDLAENVVESIVKGTRVNVQGKLKTRDYTTKEGENRTSLDCEIVEIGPSLRWATANVTRKAGSGNGGNSNGGSRSAAPADSDPFAASPF